MPTTVTIYATKEASVNEVSPNTNYSGNDYLNVGDDYFDPGQNYRTWIGFDLSSIPAGSVIDSAVLTVVPYFAGAFDYSGGNFNVQKCTDNSWTEAGITWNNAPNSSVQSAKFGIHCTEGSTGKSFTVTDQIQQSLASGGISYRIKASVEDNNSEALFTSSVYTATACSKLVITYDTTATVEGFIDVPASEDGYIYGTYDGTSEGITVFKTGSTLLLGMSSSTGVDVDQLFLLFDTSSSNLSALGLPAGATITSHYWRLYCSEAFGASTVTIGYYRGWAGELGTSIDLTDWDMPDMSTPGTRSFYNTGWYEYQIVTINDSGITAIGLKPTGVISAGDYATFHSSRNSSGNAPVLRIYYSYTPSTYIPQVNILVS